LGVLIGKIGDTDGAMLKRFLAGPVLAVFLWLSACETFYPPMVKNFTTQPVLIVATLSVHPSPVSLTLKPGEPYWFIQKIKREAQLNSLEVRFADGASIRLSRSDLERLRQQANSRSELWVIENRRVYEVANRSSIPF
jgi:hypothetical protein